MNNININELIGLSEFADIEEEEKTINAFQNVYNLILSFIEEFKDKKNDLKYKEIELKCKNKFNKHYLKYGEDSMSTTFLHQNILFLIFTILTNGNQNYENLSSHQIRAITFAQMFRVFLVLFGNSNIETLCEIETCLHSYKMAIESE